jgi:hypothetical protein
MQTLLTNENQSYKREHRAKCRTSKLRIMKKKIITFIGLALFVGAIVFNVQMTNSNKQSNEVILENIASAATSGYTCFWYFDNQYSGDQWFFDCYGCFFIRGDNPRYQHVCAPYASKDEE